MTETESATDQVDPDEAVIDGPLASRVHNLFFAAMCVLALVVTITAVSLHEDQSVEREPWCDPWDEPRGFVDERDGLFDDRLGYERDGLFDAEERFSEPRVGRC